MNTRELFLRANALCPMEQHEFLGALGDCLRALLARYPTALLAAEGDGEISLPDTLDRATGVDPLYDGALLQGVIAVKTENAGDRIAFLSEADCAYRQLWRRAARGRRTVRERG